MECETRLSARLSRSNSLKNGNITFKYRREFGLLEGVYAYLEQFLEYLKGDRGHEWLFVTPQVGQYLIWRSSVRKELNKEDYIILKVCRQAVESEGLRVGLRYRGHTQAIESKVGESLPSPGVLSVLARGSCGSDRAHIPWHTQALASHRRGSTRWGTGRSLLWDWFARFGCGWAINQRWGGWASWHQTISFDAVQIGRSELTLLGTRTPWWIFPIL